MYNEKYMLRAIELAYSGLGSVAPNPMVGCVIVHQDNIIGEGFHAVYGQAHAEVNAIKQVKNSSLLKESTLYVTLEPCSHFGKTPPCVNAIIENKIPTVVMACKDPNQKVNGSGITELKKNGVTVITGILEKEARFMNRRFMTFQEKKRPYIILKWAETADGFIDKLRNTNKVEQHQISGEPAKLLAHKWRTEEQGILVGKYTVINDNPLLTARLVSGKQPIRMVIDRNLELNLNYSIFNGDATTLIFNEKKNETRTNLIYKQINFSDFSTEFSKTLCEMNILSVIIEGGTTTLNHFIQSDIWDEARIFQSELKFNEGLSAPKLNQIPDEKIKVGADQLNIYYKSI